MTNKNISDPTLANWLGLGRERDALQGQVAALREPTARLLDMIYPADVFTGESGDPGALAVVEVRKALADTAAAAQAHDERVRHEGRMAVLAELNLPTWDPVLSATGDAGEWVKRQVREGRAEEREQCAKVADEAHAQWKKNADRPQDEHSGPSYAAAVAGEAASRDISAAIRALSSSGGRDE